jgi:hypothetical protein
MIRGIKNRISRLKDSITYVSAIFTVGSLWREKRRLSPKGYVEDMYLGSRGYINDDCQIAER